MKRHLECCFSYVYVCTAGSLLALTLLLREVFILWTFLLCEHQRAVIAGAPRVHVTQIGKAANAALQRHVLCAARARDNLSVLEALRERLLVAPALGARPLVQVRKRRHEGAVLSVRCSGRRR